MQPVPARSSGVLVSQMGDRAIAYDLLTETAHRLNGIAGELLSACTGHRDLAQLIDRWAELTGAPRQVIAADVGAALREFTRLGLVGRAEEYHPPLPPTGSTRPITANSALGEAHPVIDHRMSFRSPQPELLEVVDSFLGTATAATGTVATGTVEADATLMLDIGREPSGEVVLTADEEHRYHDVAQLLDAIPSVLNEYAAATHTCVVVHAGGVRSPEGEVVLLGGPSGAGKSTLTAAFILAGCDYLSDEAIGVRSGSLVAVGYPKPLSCGPSGRTALGIGSGKVEHLRPEELRAGVRRLPGDIGPVGRILLCSWEPTAEVVVEDLAPHDAVAGLLANTLNLARCGESGLAALCGLATTVPVQHLRHGDALSAVVHIDTR